MSKHKRKTRRVQDKRGDDALKHFPDSYDTLEFHPLANAFPLMEGADFKEFVADIKAKGLREPITMFESKILEGRNRHRACMKLKIEPRFEQFEGDEAAAAAFVISRNIHRRHLTPKQRREAIAKLLKLHPDKSNREIGRLTRTDDKTVASVRAEKEATAEIPQTKKRVGKDGRARPAKRKKRPTTVETAAAATATTVTPTAAPASTTTAAAATPTAPLAVNSDGRAAPPRSASQASGTKDLEKQIAEDRKYARDLVKQDRNVALWLRAILRSEKRRSAVADALVGALKNESGTPSSATGGNDTDAAESVEARKVLFATADREAAQ
jgi:hypothetical protein